MPAIEAALLTTAFDERSELRISRHLSQIKVNSCDIVLGSFVLCSLYFVLIHQNR
jgi:hypothetical protein